MKNDLSSLIAFVGKNVIFDEKKYPELAGASEKERFLFALRHSGLHFAKTAGKVAAVGEDLDHGGEPDVAELKKQVWKSLVNAFWLADKIGMTEEEILDAIEKKYA